MLHLTITQLAAVRRTRVAHLLLLVATVGALAATASATIQQAELPLSSTRVPAEIRTLADGRAVVIYRDAFRGYAPAGASAVELRRTDGVVLFERRPGLDVPDATIVTILDVAVSGKGQNVVSMVAARPGAGTVHVLAYYSEDGSTIRLVTAPVACFRIAAADGGIWCLGPHVERHNARRTDFQFLHLFGEDGRLIRSIGERTTFPGAPAPWDMKAQLAVSSDRVIVWMPGRRALVAFDFNGNVTDNTPVPVPPIADDPRTDFSLSPSGDLYVLGITQQPSEQIASWRRDLFSFSPRTLRWARTRIGDLSLAARLVGATTSDSVVLWDRQNARLVWMQR